MENIAKIQKAIDEGSSIEEELADIMKAKTNAQMLSIAYRIRAKIGVRNDIVCDILKVINEK